MDCYVNLFIQTARCFLMQAHRITGTHTGITRTLLATRDLLHRLFLRIRFPVCRNHPIGTPRSHSFEDLKVSLPFEMAHSCRPFSDTVRSQSETASPSAQRLHAVAACQGTSNENARCPGCKCAVRVHFRPKSAPSAPVATYTAS